MAAVYGQLLKRVVHLFDNFKLRPLAFFGKLAAVVEHNHRRTIVIIRPQAIAAA
jgi:hypothetical protein